MQQLKTNEILNEPALRSLVANCVNKCSKLEGADSVDIRYTINYRNEFSGNPNHLSVVLGNLIENGIKYQCNKTNQSYVDVFIASSQQKLTIKVLDNGAGMDASEIDNAHGAMQNNNTNKKLGLYIVNEILQKCQGAFFIESVKGSGTMVMIEIPNGNNIENKKGNRYELNNNN